MNDIHDIHYIGKSKYDPNEFGKKQVKFLRQFFGEEGFKWLEDKVKERAKMTTPEEIADEIIWTGLEKETGNPVSNVYRVCMDIQHYIIDWMEKEKEG